MNLKIKIGIILVLFLSAILRLYKLGEIPPHINWDEASLGYNAYSLLKTGKDEYGYSWPISIRSFNDYKPPAYVYLLIPSVSLFGLNEFSVRLPSAIAGLMTVFLIFLIAKELIFIKPQNLNQQWIPLVSALLLAINPWHLQFSRVAFEANIALFFFCLGAYCLLKAFRSEKSLDYLFSAVAYSATFYSYHSTRIVVPVFILITSIIFKDKIYKNIKKVITSVFLALILIFPIIITFLRGYGQSRFSTVSIFTNRGIYTVEQERFERQEEYRKNDNAENNIFSIFHRPWIILLNTYIEGYLDHFNFNYLFIEGDDNGRHSIAGMGLMYFWEIPTILIGLYYLVKKERYGFKIIIIWLLIAPIASALTTHTPHAIRSYLMLPPLILISSYGIIHLIKLLSNRWYLLIFTGLIIFINFAYYLDLYYIHTPVERSIDWQYGYKELVDKVNNVEDNYQEVIITTEYDQPYIFFLFFNKIDPLWYQQFAENGSGGFGKYIFRKIEYRRDFEYLNRLIIGVNKEIPNDALIIDKITSLNGEELFLITESKKI